MSKPLGTRNGEGTKSGRNSLKPNRGPKCPRCCGLLKKRDGTEGKFYECPRHGFVRDVMSPQ